MMKFFSALCLCMFSIQTVAQEPKPSQSYSDGWDAFRRSDYKSATDHFRQAIAEKPDLLMAHYKLGRALVMQKEYLEALDAFNQLLKLNPPAPEDLYAHYEIGKIYLLMEDYSRGIAEYQWLKAKELKNSQSTDTQVSSSQTTESPRTEVQVKTDSDGSSLAMTLTQYLLDMIPAEIAESNNLPPSKLVHAQPPSMAMQPNSLQSEAGSAPPVPKEQQGLRVASVSTSPTEPMTANMRPKILYQEKAKYTEIARRNWIQGTVMLSVVFEASGQLSGFRVIRGLPDGLTQSAVRAAQKIRFMPAKRDGAPVSVRGTMEFSFSLY